MAEAALEKLAAEAGLALHWTDAEGQAQTVGAEVLRAVLGALELPAANDRQIRDSRARLAAERKAPPRLRVVAPGAMVDLGIKRSNAWLIAEDGTRIKVTKGSSRAPRRPGFYRLEDIGQKIAVVPPRAFLPSAPLWGIGVQLYALRGGTSGGFGDFAALRDFCRQAAAVGAGAVAVSPVHALFAAAPDHYSPYAPSTRLWLNPLYAALSKAAPDRSEKLIDWPETAKRKWVALRAEFQAFRRGPDIAAFQDFVRRKGTRLLSHARFEVLDARFRAKGIADWRNWPQAFRDPEAKAVRALSPEDPEVAFHLFLQWRADRDLAEAHAAAKAAGMSLGLIADMAVGMDPAGSHAWSAREEVLQDLTVGAPPDMFNRQGQNWGLTQFSPHGLIRTGYQGFLATLRAAMRHAGGVRLDHAMGLKRLWVIPKGADAKDGIYLTYPFRELLGLLALESRRHGAMVLAEDLGTVPPGFREDLSRAAVPGMRVLWFERDGKGDFLLPAKWQAQAAALSTTHDLPTLAGWWRGADIGWRARLGQPRSQILHESRQRSHDRKKLWTMLKQAGCAKGPAPRGTSPFVNAAFAALAKTPCLLKLLPVEDFLGALEQPNIPGTIDEHPNWRRRLKSATPLAGKKARQRAAILGKRR